ncbi:hypothetical protein B0T22DRAFT_479454 [Podospora appendiculata]|uniref:Uncharacterized protein n=1 Tax=Podospora appendiculata TaxID=314037 RepID=A0AAE1CC75_9PEZI|nr:hypothetical protein B0T22DRAFT_479454 [Podospora appendiculata]
MESHVLSATTLLPPTFLHQLVHSGAFDEISNHRGSVRHHIFWHGKRDRPTNTLFKAMLFFVYQTGRHGPQNGYRLCLVHQGFHIASPTKDEGEPEDEIDRLEKDIPQGHMEVVVLGEPVYYDDD